MRRETPPATQLKTPTDRLVALAFLGVATLALAHPALPQARPTPTPVEEVLDLPTAGEVQELMQSGDTAGGLNALGKLRAAAATRGEWTEWLKLLNREALALVRSEGAGSVLGTRPDFGPAIRHVEEVVAPGPVEVEAARLLLLAGLHQRTAEIGAGFQGDALTRAQVPAHLKAAVDALARAFARRAELGDKGRDVLALAGGGPAVRATARDVVTYLFVDGLEAMQAQDRRAAGSTPVVSKLLAPSSGDARESADPLTRLASALDDLERWHAASGRRAAALEARLERSRALFAALPDQAQRAAVVADLKSRLAAWRDGPWWSAGMAELALLVNEVATTASEPLAIAEEGRLAYPTSDGGKRCDGIARILRLELDDPELTLAAATSAMPGTPVLEARTRRPATLRLRAWPTAAEAGDPVPSNETPIEWTATLPGGKDDSEVVTELKGPLPAGRYRVDATLSPSFGSSTPMLSVLVTDLLLAVTSEGPSLLVRALSASTGQPVAGARVRLLFQVPLPRVCDPVELGSAVTGRDGLAVFDHPDVAQGLTVSAMHGRNVATVGIPWRQTETPHPLTRAFGALGVDRIVAAPGERVRWRAVALEDAGGGAVRPLAGTALTVTLRQTWGAAIASFKATTSRFGTASGVLELPTGPPPRDGWHLTMEDPGGSGMAQVMTRISLAQPPSSVLVALDPLGEGERPGTVSMAGTVLGADSRPLPGAAVSWQVQGNEKPKALPRVSQSRNSSRSVVASGDTVAGKNGRFTAAFALGPWKSSTVAVVVTATDGEGNATTVQRGVELHRGPVRLDIGGALVLQQGETARLRLTRRLVDGYAGALGESVVRLLRLPWVEEHRQPVYHWLADNWSGNRPDRLAETPEDLLRTLPAGEEVARSTAKHDRSGVASLTFAGLAPGVYRVVAEARNGEEAGRATRHLVVNGPGVRLPLPLALLTDPSDPERPRILVSSSSGTGPVVIELRRPGRPVEPRLLDSPTTLVLEEPPGATVDVRVFAVHRGRLLALSSALWAAPQSLRIELEGATPDVVVRVADADAGPVGGVEIALAAIAGNAWLPTDVPRRWPARVDAPFWISDRGMAYAQRVYPASLGEWSRTQGVHRLEEGRFVVTPQSGGFHCGTGEPPRRPTLPLLSRQAESSWQPQSTATQPWVDRQPIIWEPHLTSDSEGRVRVPLPPGAQCGTLWIGATAVASDGRAASLQTQLAPDAGGCQ